MKLLLALMALFCVHLGALAADSFADLIEQELPEKESYEEREEAKLIFYREMQAARISLEARINDQLKKGELSPQEQEKIELQRYLVDYFEEIRKTLTNETYLEIRRALINTRHNPLALADDPEAMAAFCTDIAQAVRIANEFDELSPRMVGYAGEIFSRILLADPSKMPAASKRMAMLGLAAIVWERGWEYVTPDFFKLQTLPRRLPYLVLSEQYRLIIGSELSKDLEAIFFGAADVSILGHMRNTPRLIHKFYEQGGRAMQLMAEVERMMGKRYENNVLRQHVVNEMPGAVELKVIYEKAIADQPGLDDFGARQVRYLSSIRELNLYAQKRYLDIARGIRGR